MTQEILNIIFQGQGEKRNDSLSYHEYF